MWQHGYDKVVKWSVAPQIFSVYFDMITFGSGWMAWLDTMATAYIRVTRYGIQMYNGCILDCRVDIGTS